MISQIVLFAFAAFFLLNVFCEVSKTHVALACERVVHSKCSSQTVLCMSALSKLKVVPEQLLIVWMNAVFNDALSTLDWVLSAEVGNKRYAGFPK